MLSKDELLLAASIMMDKKIKPLDMRLKYLEKVHDDALLARIQQNRDVCNMATCQQYQCDDEHTRFIQDDKNNPKKIIAEITIDFRH